MNVRIDPATLAELAGGIERSTDELGKAQPLPPGDAGPSSAAVSATVADLIRAAAGYVETVHRGAADLHANKATYIDTDDGNAGMFEQLGC
ncbi:hypothetical protein GCM10011581_27000 [Saccharopolyspora subtropica]|uniref:Uncharacterized protein n=1 Tax=Saccharopolyspora thermophila TaxID=89367 RepID=A0A917JV88_9PSEU|nr:hypothetical protein [Saccharopolyspora subtropica]GGI88491.1 hypothetical protein GCM10011581_27000 [Saccharopolyspora subtropica]